MLVSIARQGSPMLENTRFGNPSRMTDKTTKSSLFEKREKKTQVTCARKVAYGSTE